MMAEPVLGPDGYRMTVDEILAVKHTWENLASDLFASSRAIHGTIMSDQLNRASLATQTIADHVGFLPPWGMTKRDGKIMGRHASRLRKRYVVALKQAGFRDATKPLVANISSVPISKSKFGGFSYPDSKMDRKCLEDVYRAAKKYYDREKRGGKY